MHDVRFGISGFVTVQNDKCTHAIHFILSTPTSVQVYDHKQISNQELKTSVSALHIQDDTSTLRILYIHNMQTE